MLLTRELINSIPSPCFVLEEALLTKNLAVFAQLQEQVPIKVMLALKGFALFHCFPILQPILQGASASSLWEAQLGKELGGEVHVYSPVYRQADFADILPLASHLTFNSLTQLARFQPLIAQSEYSPSVGVRINPEYSPVTTDLYNPCVTNSRLGIRQSQLGDTLPAGIDGFLSHNLCESDSFALEKTLSQIENLFGRFLPQLKWLNLGGGHLMTTDDYDLDHAITVLNNFHSRHPHLRLIMEPGSAIAWQTGFLLSTVEDLIPTADCINVMLDMSFTAHTPDCLEMPYRPMVRDSHLPEAGETVYRLGGSSCLAGDALGDYGFSQDLAVGDHLIFEDMMHYTMVKTTMFNGVYHPSIGMIKKDGYFVLWREFNYDDYKSRLG